MKVPKDYRPMVRAALDAGWRIKETAKGHIKLMSPDGETSVILPSSSRSTRGIQNVASILKKAGVSA